MVEESLAGRHHQIIYLGVDRHGEGTVALHRQLLVGSVVSYHRNLGSRQLVAIHLVNPTLHGGDNLRILEGIDVVVAASILSIR